MVPPSPWGIITRRHGPLPGNLEFDNALALATPYGGPPEKWMDTPWFPQLTAYAAGKKIAVYGWDHMCNLDTPEKRRTQLDWYVAKGFKGIKVDFLDSDVQARYRLREDLARDCAARHLLISYHGDITPRGMQRTWPNIATHEGVLAEEFYLGFGPFAPSPAYNVNLVFTRNVAGSMDYTRIAADPLTVDAAQPLVINMPANGGCGFRVMKGARNSP
ncbi:MAG: glycoside hydrolase family 97 catalytic domain-containing protein [Verrucomicrobia bacterium]|nr:glycoside hydrolase family 97 catalytic domain-containing protein [Verrucomicrobiota bacterium]